MPRDYLPGPSRPVPLIASGERERLSFWRQHAVAIPSELLEITGWLAHAAEHGTLTNTGGEVRRVAPGMRPPNVLFLVPRDGGRTYQNWEWCLNYLRMEQSRRRLVQQQIEQATERVRAADAELERIRSQHEALDTRLRSLAEGARDCERRGDVLRRATLLAELKIGIAGAREDRSAFRIAERHKDTARLRLEGLQDHLAPQVYPGLWARVNAFLDLQALSVANVASEEFRKVPRSLARVASRFEQDLEED